MDLNVAKRITNSLVKLRPKSDMYHLVNGKFTPLGDHSNGSTSSQTVIDTSNGKKKKGNPTMTTTTATATTTVSGKNGACGGYFSKLTKSISQDTIGCKNKRSVTPKKTSKSESNEKMLENMQLKQVTNNCITVSGTVDAIEAANGPSITNFKGHSKLKSTKSFGTYSVLQDALNSNGSTVSTIDEISASCEGETNDNNSKKQPSNVESTNGKVLDLSTSEIKFRMKKNQRQMDQNLKKLLRHSAIDPGSNKQYSFGQMEAYIRLDPLGEGSYATVYKGFSK